MTQETNDVVTQELIERLGLHQTWRDSHGELNNAPNEARSALQSQSARIAELDRVIDRVVSGGLPEQLLADADELEGCGAGNEAKRMRELVARLKEFRRVSLTKDSTSGCPKCGGSHKTGPGLGDCDGPPTPSRPHPHARDMIA